MGEAMKMVAEPEADKRSVKAEGTGPAPKTPPRGVMIAAATFGMLGVCVGGGYLYWTTTPTYALTKIAAAVQAKDSAAFHAYVDVDKVIDAAFDDILGSAMETAGDQKDGVAAFGATLGAGFAQILKPQIKTAINREVDKFFDPNTTPTKAQSEKSTPTVADSSFQNLAELRYVAAEKNFKGLQYVRTNGSISNAGLALYVASLKKDFILDLKMEKGDQWHVTQITNLATLLGEIRSAEKAELDAFNANVDAELKAAITLARSKVATQPKDKWGFKKVVLVGLEIKNELKKPVKKIDGTIAFQSTDGGELGNMRVTSSTAIGANAAETLAWEKETNMFSASDQKLIKTNPNDVRITFTVDRIEFADGSQLSHAHSISDVRSAGAAH